MRETELWRRLSRSLGERYARSWAASTALGPLGSRTVDEAIADGEDVRRIWEACWSALELPDTER